MTKNHQLSFLLVALLPACDPGPSADAGIDPTDARDSVETSVVDAPLDAPPSEPALPALRAAFANNVATFCACLPMRNPGVTTEECEATSSPDPETTACEDRAVGVIGAAFDAYYRCRTAAVESLDRCYQATCSDAAVTACNGDFQTESTACNARLPAMAVVQSYLEAYQACIVERVIGAMASCPDDAATSSSDVGPSVFSGTTALAGNDSEPHMDCFSDAMSAMDAMGSPDRSYRWIAPAAGRYRIDTVGSSFDTILYVRSACTDAVDVACADDIVLGTDQDSCVVVDAAAGEEFVVVVDGFGDLVRGDFVVNIAADATCAPSFPDGGLPDGGLPDGGMPDAGAPDGGMPDAP